MTPILAAMGAGYGEEEIIKYLTKTIPGLSDKVKKAKNSGYSVASILNFISNTMQGSEYDPRMSESEAHGMQRKRQDALTKGLIKGTAATFAGYGIARALPAAAQAIKGAVKGVSQPKIGPQPMAGAPVQPAQPPSIPTPPPSPAAAARSTATETLNAASPEFQQWANQQITEGKEKPLPEMMKAFQKIQGKKEPTGLMKGAQEDVAKMQEPAEPLKFEKGSIVATPEGNVGYIKDIKQKEALVDEDGKLHKVKLTDLQLPDETVVQTVSRLLEMPEIEKSALINYWSYDPEDNELFVMYHNGETYKYDEVPEEMVAELQDASVSPKTKGQNEFGAWAQEDPMSRGATFIQKLIAHPKYKKPRKGEPENKYYRKLRKGYDYWARLRKGG